MYKEKAKEIRLDTLALIHKGQTSHIASCFSLADIACVLYENLKENDEVVWSKGWASALYYVIASRRGIIDKKDLFDKFPSEPYLALLETSSKGVQGNFGSMGHGLPIACGMAYAKKLKGEAGNIYCIMSDGEMNEGTTWESTMFARHHRLNNLKIIVDKNKWQAMGRTEEVLDVDVFQAFAGFGFVVESIEGHSYPSIESSIKFFHPELPSVVVANTIKGKGVSFFEDSLVFHYSHVDDENYKLAKAELENA